jgi:exodeoxyribonuclease-5
MTDRRLAVDDLSPDQEEVYDRMRAWSASPFTAADRGYEGSAHLLTIGGLAGVGKTSLLGVFAANTDLLVAYVTFTGRASSILSRKLKAAGAQATDKMRPPPEMRMRGRALDLYDATLGSDSGPSFVGTIHRLLYRPVIDNETEELTGWVKRTALDRRYDLIVIDEASMVGASMLLDLKAHGVPIMAVGDHGQLPPVMDAGDLMKNPDLRLEKIHRQAAESPIIRMAHHIRETGRLEVPGSFCGLTAVQFAPMARAAEVLSTAYLGFPFLDVGVLCWTNRIRVILNGMARKVLGFGGPPKAGEVVIALRNEPPVYNGMRGLLTADAVECKTEGVPWILGVSIEYPDEGLPSDSYLACAPQFCREKTFASTEELKERGMPASFKKIGSLFDFGYALTCHKAQGSQFEHAIVYLDRPQRPDDEGYRRWLYSAVTRASERLTVIQ